MKALTYSTFALLVGLLVGAYFFIHNAAFGSVNVGMEYQARQFNNTASATTSLRTGYGSIGSVVVASSSAAGQTISFYDTAGNSTTTSATTTLVMRLNTAVNPGTYEFDVAVNRGLLIELTPGFTGDAIVTFR